MKKMTITFGDESGFFSRGRALAALADAGQPVPETSLISFGDPADLLKVLTPARLALIDAVKAQPSSITAIAQRLQRDRASVSKDVDKLQTFGLLQVEHKTLAGHGKHKEVRLTAPRMQLSAVLA